MPDPSGQGRSYPGTYLKHAGEVWYGHPCWTPSDSIGPRGGGVARASIVGRVVS